MASSIVGYPASAPKFTVGFFLRRRGLPVENNNKFSRQFLQVTFEMLQMSQVRLSLLFSWDGLEPSLLLNKKGDQWIMIPVPKHYLFASFPNNTQYSWKCALQIMGLYIIYNILTNIVSLLCWRKYITWNTNICLPPGTGPTKTESNTWS